jgi:hypothetical protein
MRTTYTSKIVFRGAGGMQTFEVGSRHNRLRAGQTVTVYYDPDNVAEASLNPPAPGDPLSRLVGFASAGFLLMAIGCGGFVRVTRRLLKPGR